MSLRNRIADFLGTDEEDYTTIYATTPETEIRIHTDGLGDVMMGRQFISGFKRYIKRFGDPEIGNISLGAGGIIPYHEIPEAETTIYWWYSFGPFDEKPEQFLDGYFRKNVSADIDLMLCSSERIQREAEQAGYETLLFPIGTAGYEPLDLKRKGLGYAGSKGHKGEEKIAKIMGPYIDDPEFEWVDHFSTIDELNLWYNKNLITFGLTKEGQRQWGVVNSRVFESLASGTPLVLETHPTIEEVLGFEYPYQAEGPDDVKEIVSSIRDDPERHRERFNEYSRRIREDHSYFARIQTLFERLE